MRLPKPIKVKVANQTRAHLLGRIQADITFGETPIQATIYVVYGVAQGILIGLDVLNTHPMWKSTIEKLYEIANLTKIISETTCQTETDPVINKNETEPQTEPKLNLLQETNSTSIINHEFDEDKQIEAFPVKPAIIEPTTAMEIITDDESDEEVEQIQCCTVQHDEQPENNQVTEKEFRNEIENIQKQLNKITAKKLTELEPIEGVSHIIKLTNDEPVKQKLRRIPYHKKIEVKQQLQEMLDAGLITTSDSPYRSNLRLVGKPDKSEASGSLRIMWN